MLLGLFTQISDPALEAAREDRVDLGSVRGAHRVLALTVPLLVNGPTARRGGVMRIAIEHGCEDARKRFHGGSLLCSALVSAVPGSPVWPALI